MYTDFFQLREMPFSISPDPAYLYMSPRHQEALGHLLYGTGQYGGFVQLTGEVGTGKTTIVRTLLEQKLANLDVAMIHNPRQNEEEFVQSICDELGIHYPRERLTLKVLVDALNEHLLRSHAAGRRTVVIIDEAQNLQPSVLEQVRLLTNLETSKEKLLRIMLIGQPELSALLARPDLRQLASRITARYHLTPLSAAETREYIEHRLRVAGAQSEIFPQAAIQKVYQYARGVPRLINIICDRALLGAYAQQTRKVSPQIVSKAATEALGQLPGDHEIGPHRRMQWTDYGWIVAVALCTALFVWSYTRTPTPPAPVAVGDTAPAKPPTMASAKTLDAADPEIPAQPPLATPPTLSPALPVSAAAGTARKEEGGLTALSSTAQPLNVVVGRMIRLWDADLTISRGESVCETLHRRGLECYRSQGSWTDLGQMNRPAVLTLDLPELGAQYFLLRQLSTTHASLDTALGTLQIPLDELDSVWNGEFLLLWRRETAETYIGESTAGASIPWLWQRLASMGAATLPDPIPRRYDSGLNVALRNFQRERGLIVDGTAGIRTLIALGEGQPGTPTLAAPNP